MAPKIAIIHYSTYGHIEKLALAELEGIKKAGGAATIYRVAETLPEDVLLGGLLETADSSSGSRVITTKMYAPPKTDYPVITPDEMTKYDAFLLGIPTRFGNMPAQWKTFWDSTGQIWASGGLWGKYVGLFVSSGGQGGGQESTAITAMSTLVHHGLIYVPLGGKMTSELMAEVEEVRGGSFWGAGTFAGGTGQRQPSQKELDMARIQGEVFWNAVAKVNFE